MVVTGKVELTLEGESEEEIQDVVKSFLFLKKLLGNHDFIKMARKLRDKPRLLSTAKKILI